MKIEEVHSWNIPRVVTFLVIFGILLFGLYRGISSITPESENEGTVVIQSSTNFVVPTEETMQPETAISVVPELSGEQSATYQGQAKGSDKMLSGDASTIESNSAVGSGTPERESAPQTDTNGGALGGEVTRAQFTRAVRNNEPVDSVSSPVQVSSEKAMTLSYFTRLEGMAGEAIRHRWQHDGRVVAEIKFDVDGDPYPVYSSKFLNDTMLGRWRVVVLNNAGAELKSEEILVVDKMR